MKTKIITTEPPFCLHMQLILTVVLLLLFSEVVSSQTNQDWVRRDRWQKPDDIVNALHLKPGQAVADIGVGDGYLLRYLSKLVGTTGRVYAVDIDEETLESLAKQFSDQYPQISTVHGAEDNPRLPASELDGAVMLHAYHEMTAYYPMLRNTFLALKPGARLVIVDAISDSRLQSSRSVQTEKHEVAASFVSQELRDTGFEVLSVEERFAKHPYHDRMWMIIARKPNTTESEDN